MKYKIWIGLLFLGLQACSSYLDKAEKVDDIYTLKDIGDYYLYVLEEPEKAEPYFDKLIALGDMSVDEKNRLLAPPILKDDVDKRNHRLSTAYRKAQAKCDYTYAILKDREKAISACLELAAISPYQGHRILSEIYLGNISFGEIQEEVDEIKAEKHLKLLALYDVDKCDEDETVPVCQNTLSDMYLSWIYLHPTSKLYDLDKGEKLLLRAGKQGLQWAQSELIYFYECQKPDKDAYTYWHKKRFPNEENHEMGWCIIEPIPYRMDRFWWKGN